MAYWIFKCDPKRYRLDDRLADPESSNTWLVTRYKDEITIGDTAFLMGTGPKRAIRALMRIDHAPRIMPELESEQVYWKKRDTEARCRVEGTLIARVNVAIEKLRAHEDLKGLSIFHGWQQQTNFRVSDEEGRVILGLVSS